MSTFYYLHKLNLSLIYHFKEEFPNNDNCYKKLVYLIVIVRVVRYLVRKKPAGSVQIDNLLRKNVTACFC